ncbi:MAG: hypothetical protein NTY75_03590 [Candidatus Shapirobacteria bacterium]|nr:hypothetical protein [Candidatus Shapirobacteria bacterium]
MSLRPIFIFCFILTSYFINHISVFAAAVPPVIPDSINPDQLFTGSFDPQYPNKDFIPNNPSGVTCEYQVTAEQDVGGSSSGTITINKDLSNQKTDFDNRLLGKNLYDLTPCDPGAGDYNDCLSQRNNSMNTDNLYGAASPVQRQLPQADKNKLLCSRWHSGILSGRHVADTDERVGCYCGGDSSSIPSGACPANCREVYFSELALFNTSFCDLPADIAAYYNCGSGNCPFFKREPKAKNLPQISSVVASQLMKNVSIVPKGSVATSITQTDKNKTSLGVLPFLMAPSSNQSDTAIKTVFPASAQPKNDNPSCSPVSKPSGPDEYKFDLIAEILALVTGNKASGDAPIKQEFSSGTIQGLNSASSLNTLVPQSQLDLSPPTKTEYSVTGDKNDTILNPSTNVNQFRLNLTPASWQQ